MGKLICFSCGHAMSDHWSSGGVATCTAADKNGNMCGCTIASK